MRLLNGCLLLLAAGLAILLGIIGAGAFFVSLAGAPGGSGHWFAVVAWVVYAFLLLATATLVISLKLPYRRVPQAPRGWLAIIGGMILLLTTPIIGGLFLGGVTEGTPGWVAGLAIEGVVAFAMFLVVVGGVRAVAVGVESLRLPGTLARLVLGGQGPEEDASAGTFAVLPRVVEWFVTADQRPRSRRVVMAAFAEAICGALIVLVALAASFGRGGLAETWWAIAWGALGLLSATGLYFRIRPASVTSFAFSAPTAVLVGVALAIGGADPSNEAWQLVVGALLVLLALATLYGLGMLGRLTDWLSSA